MRKKPREINVFSLSFIDVFCCALGAMILIFVLNSRALTGHVKSAVDKYRQESVKAEKQRDQARISRDEAQKSREEAEKSRNEALMARDLAEKAEQKALLNEKMALLAREQALEEKKSQEKARQEVEIARLRIESLLLEARQNKLKLERINNSLQEKNRQLAKKNRNLKKMVDERHLQNEQLQKFLAENERLSKTSESLEAEKDSLRESIDLLKKEKEKAEKEKERLTRWFHENEKEKKDMNSLYEEEQARTSELEKRLTQKQNELRAKEEQIKKKEALVSKREKEILQQEKLVEHLNEQLEEKGEASLFGIKLNYHRIAFLVDKSGSIIQNKWKEEVIGTCEQILEHCQVDEFSIIAFSSDMKLFPSRKGTMVAGNKENKKKAIRWLSSTRQVRFGGYTNVNEALRIAYENYGNLDAIFLLTDGLPAIPGKKSEDLQKQIEDYIQKQVNKKIPTRIITIAIGYPPIDKFPPLRGKSHQEVKKYIEENADQYGAIYRYLHKISKMTGGQYLGR